MSWSGDCVKKWGFLIIVLAVFITPSLVAQQGDEFSQLRNEAIQAYRDWMKHKQQADLDRAIHKFNEFLLKNPSDADALKLREQAGRDMMLHMLMYGEKTQGETARIARAILLYAEKRPAIRIKRDEEQIEQLVQMVATGNMAQRHEAMTLLQTQIGELAIPYMIEYLKTKNEDQKIQMFLAITRIGRIAVVPLIEVISPENNVKASDPKSQELIELKQQVAVLLGHIGDIRALPDLQRLTKDPAEDAEARKYAQEAIKKIVGKSEIALPAAAELYYQKALAYYLDDPAYKPAVTFRQRFCWRWENGKLVSKEVAPFVYNEVMAEHACFRALKLDPSLTKVWALLVRIYYSEYTKVALLKEAYIAKREEFPEEVKEELKKEEGEEGKGSPNYATKARDIVTAAGPEILYEALTAALREKRPEITVAILEDIGETSKGRGDVPAPVLSALKNEDRKIRFAAAEALVKINPARRFTGSNQVVEILKDALTEGESFTVLIIEDDSAARNELVSIIRKDEKAAFGAANAIEGLQRARIAVPNVVIISTELKDLDNSFQTLFNDLKEDTRTMDIPIILIASEGNVENEKLKLYPNLEKKGVVHILVKGSGHPLFSETMVKTAVGKALEASEKASTYYAKMREKIAIRAVNALASISPTSEVFNLSAANTALLKLLDEPGNDKRVPAIQALGNLGEKEAERKLLEILEKDKDLSVRNLAAWALGQIFNKTHKMKEKAEDKASRAGQLVKILCQIEGEIADADSETLSQLQELRAKVLYLLGQANIAPEDRLALIFEQYRVHGPIEMAAAKESAEEAFFEEPAAPPAEPGDDDDDDDTGDDDDDDDDTGDDDDDTGDDDDD